MTPLVKICGIRRLGDARLACEMGAAAIGFVFWPSSPRFIDPDRARAIVAELPPFAAPIGVFVDQSPDYIAGVAGLVKLAAVQLHGSEPPEAFLTSRVRVIKAVPVNSSFEPARACADLPARATMLLDAHDPIRRGGTGRTIDWEGAADAARRRRVILSGGLTCLNVAAAIAKVQPYAVDVSSGVEAAPGVKDREKLEAFFAAVTGTEAITHTWQPDRGDF
jgi:phosphoribosylanthranilate isomerase